MKRGYLGVSVAVALLTLCSCLVVHPLKSVAATGINQQLSFEGKVVTSAGINIPDGTYNVEFKIYSGGTATGGGTLVWTEDWLVRSSQGVSFASGTYQVNLGSICSLAGGSCQGLTNTGVNWNSNPLYLSLQIGDTSSCTVITTFQTNCNGDGEMTPFILLTAAPYAFNADKLDGLDSAAFGQLGGNQTWSGTNNIATTSLTAFQVSNGVGIATLTTDTSGGRVLLGQVGSSGVNGQLVFNSATVGGYGVTLNTSGSQTASYTLTLPTSGPSTNQCLQSGAVTASQMIFGTCATLQSAYNAGHAISTTAAGTIAISAGAIPTADMMSISNAGQPTTTADANALSINYVGGNAAVESSGLRIDYTPGGTSGGIWSGLRIVANTTGAASGVTAYGLKLEGPTTPGSGTEVGIGVTTGFDIGIDVQSGGLQLADMSDPSSPTAGNLKVYAKLIDGRSMLKVVGPSGVNYPLQPSLFQNQVTMINVQSGTGANLFGTNRTTSGTAVSAAFNETYGYMAGYSTGTTANTTAGQGSSVLEYARGSVVGANGFFVNVRGAMQDASYTSSRIFVGMTDQSVSNSVAAQNQTGNRAGFSFDTGRGDTSWKFSVKDGTTENLVDTGMSFTAATPYDWYIYVGPYPNNGTMYWRIDNMSTGVSKEGSVSTNLPTGSQALRLVQAIRNLSAVNESISFQRLYVESDR